MQVRELTTNKEPEEVVDLFLRSCWTMLGYDGNAMSPEERLAAGLLEQIVIHRPRPGRFEFYARGGTVFAGLTIETMLFTGAVYSGPRIHVTIERNP